MDDLIDTSDGKQSPAPIATSNVAKTMDPFYLQSSGANASQASGASGLDTVAGDPSNAAPLVSHLSSGREDTTPTSTSPLPSVPTTVDSDLLPTYKQPSPLDIEPSSFDNVTRRESPRDVTNVSEFDLLNDNFATSGSVNPAGDSSHAISRPAFSTSDNFDLAAPAISGAPPALPPTQSPASLDRSPSPDQLVPTETRAVAPNIMEVSGLFETASPWQNSPNLQGFSESLVGAEEFDEEREDLHSSATKDRTLTLSDEDPLTISAYAKADLVEDDDDFGLHDTQSHATARDVSACKDFSDFGNEYVASAVDASIFDLNKSDPFGTPERRGTSTQNDPLTISDQSDQTGSPFELLEKPSTAALTESLLNSERSAPRGHEEELNLSQFAEPEQAKAQPAPQPEKENKEEHFPPPTRSVEPVRQSESAASVAGFNNDDSFTVGKEASLANLQHISTTSSTASRNTSPPNIDLNPLASSKEVKELITEVSPTSPSRHEEEPKQEAPTSQSTHILPQTHVADANKDDTKTKPSPASTSVSPPRNISKMSSEGSSSDKVSSTCECPFAPSSWLKPEALNPKVAELVYWKDPKKSGIAFGIGLVILLSLACCSIISVVSYTALLALTGTLSFRIYKNILQAVQKTNEGHPFKDYLEVEISPPNERVHQVVDVLLKHVNAVVTKLRSVFLVEDIVDSLKFVVLFWVLTYIGAWFNGLTLVILAYLGAFSLPKVYELNKAQVDQILQLACTHVQDVISKVKAVIPFPAAKPKEQ